MIFSQIERLCVKINRRKLHLRQQLEENNEFNVFTNCRIRRQCCELEEVTFGDV